MAITAQGGDAPVTAEDDFQHLLRRFRASYPTFRISDAVIRRYHLAIGTRGFVILCGASGTGKTWLAQAYADCVGARTKLVAVDPSWSSNEDLLGFLSPLDGFFHGTPFSEFVKESAREWESANREYRRPRLFHVILDEMNLARVEHYFSRFLSAMEIRSREGAAQLDLAPGHHVELTPNLRFTGTVNVDETTHGFADKVFDRAQVLELPLPRDEVDRPPRGRAARRRADGRVGRAAARGPVRVPRPRRDRHLPDARRRRSGRPGVSPWTSSSCRRCSPGSAAT